MRLIQTNVCAFKTTWRIYVAKKKKRKKAYENTSSYLCILCKYMIKVQAKYMYMYKYRLFIIIINEETSCFGKGFIRYKPGFSFNT
jgi:hypothetical protein